MANLVEILKPGASKYRHLAPDGMKWAIEKQHAFTVIKSSKALTNASPESLLNAILQAASMGLTLNPSAGLCYLIPRRARKMRKGEDKARYEKEVPTFAYASPSYKGLMFIAREQGVISYAVSEVVYKADDFIHQGPMSPVHHRPSLDLSGRSEAQAIGVYCTAVMMGGGFMTEYLDRTTVLRIRALSDFPTGMMWDPHKLWTQGWRKAVIRRAWNSWPKSHEGRMSVATSVLNTFEGNLASGEDQSSDHVEAVALLGDPEFQVLHAMLTDHDRRQPEKDLNRLAGMFGHKDIRDLPLAEFASAKEVLRNRLTMIGGEK